MLCRTLFLVKSQHCSLGVLFSCCRQAGFGISYTFKEKESDPFMWHLQAWKESSIWYYRRLFELSNALVLAALLHPHILPAGIFSPKSLCGPTKRGLVARESRVFRSNFRKSSILVRFQGSVSSLPNMSPLYSIGTITAADNGLGDNECALAIGLNPRKTSDTATWAGVWDAAVQGTELCAKNGSPGIVDTFGRSATWTRICYSLTTPSARLAFELVKAKTQVD